MPLNQPIIEVFSEGTTERSVIESLCRRGVCTRKMQERGGGGDPAFLRNLSDRLQRWAELEPGDRETLHLLVLRDLDQHMGKTLERLQSGVLDRVRRHFPQAELTPQSDYNNVFVLRAGVAGLQMVLHIANRFYAADFVKATIDDYVLELALHPITAERLLGSRRTAGQRQQPPRDWPITAAALIEKVTREIPDLLQKNHIPPLLEAKEYLRFYAALLQLHSSPQTFAGKVLEHAQEQEIRAVFAPLLAAIQSFSEEPEVA